MVNCGSPAQKLLCVLTPAAVSGRCRGGRFVSCFSGREGRPDGEIEYICMNRDLEKASQFPKRRAFKSKERYCGRDVFRDVEIKMSLLPPGTEERAR
jgi:hypothetical protein